MIIIEPVIETRDAEGFTAWPVGAHPDPEGLALSGALAPADVGTAMAVIAVYNKIVPSGEKEDERPSPAHLIQCIAQADCLIAPGGLRVRDTTTGLTVSPGCRCGLETWQEWNHVAAGQAPWLGHSPTPWLEHHGHTLRVWPDGGLVVTPSAGAFPIEIPVSDLPGLIAGAHEQLQGSWTCLSRGRSRWQARPPAASVPFLPLTST